MSDGLTHTYAHTCTHTHMYVHTNDGLKCKKLSILKKRKVISNTGSIEKGYFSNKDKCKDRYLNSPVDQ